jgi:predicted DNA-binding transcriptional regulator AlpA
MPKKSDDGVYRDGRRLITRKDVRAKTNWSDATLSRRIKAGVFPAPIRMGPRCDRWFEDVVDATIENIRDNPPPPDGWGNPPSGTGAGTRGKISAALQQS